MPDSGCGYDALKSRARVSRTQENAMAQTRERPEQR